MQRVKTALLVGASALALGACQMNQMHERELVVSQDVMSEFLADKPEQVQRLYRRVPLEGRRNFVLNHNRAGLAAMEVGAYDLAAQSFDISLQEIEAIYADNEDASKARSVYYKENIKAFKGEPYERAMAYYYRGLLYLRVGDFDNARASFKGGMLQDGLAEEEKYRSDFALLAFLEGWASQCQKLADLAKESFEEAVAVSVTKTIKIPPANHNVLLIAETGRGPVKVGKGEFNHVLTFAEGTSDQVARAEFEVASVKAETFHAEDLYWQATTRGGRPIDGILKNKAVWKGEFDTVANVLVGVGATTAMYGAASGNDNAAIAGGIMLLMGAIAKANAAAMNPAADIRQWDNLPGKVHLTTMALPQLGQADMSAKATFLTPDGRTTTSAPQIAPISVGGSCGIGWIRSVSALSVPDMSPGAVVTATK